MKKLISIKQAAEILQRSERSVYGYISSGELPAYRFTGTTRLDEEVVRAFSPIPPGRTRSRQPTWHTPQAENAQVMTIIQVPVRAGQQEHLKEILEGIRRENRHTFPGTVARYIMQCIERPDEIQIMLAWRKTLMPPVEEREAALDALRAELADVLAWEHAHTLERRVMIHA